MGRKSREISNTGVYHVMLRGINKQSFLLEDDDYICFINILADAHNRIDEQGNIVGRNECEIYAYCLMPNHIHLLIREKDRSISQIMQKIEDRFVFFYNKKYDRTGHLFQARFKSEPVNDKDYCHRLLRYIHRNPVNPYMAASPELYKYSSWIEYLDTSCFLSVIDKVLTSFGTRKVCRTDVILKMFDRIELIEWVNNDVKDNCMDIGDDRVVLSDSQAWEILQEESNAESVETFKQFLPEVQLRFIRQAIFRGVSIRQASRLSSMSYSKIQRSLVNQG